MDHRWAAGRWRQEAGRAQGKAGASGWGWVDDFSGAAVKTIGALEVLAAVGLILPAVLDIAPVLVPLAAVGLVLLMIGAMVVHLRRHEAQVIVVNLVLLALAGFVAWGRFVPTRESAFTSAKRPDSREVLTALNAARPLLIHQNYIEFSRVFREGVALALHNGGKLEDRFAADLAKS